MRPFFLDAITGESLPRKKYYDIVSFLVTQFTFCFATTPFLILSFSDSFLAWSRVYFYALAWTVVSLGFFSSPGKAWLKDQYGKRQGKASVKVHRSLSTDSLSGREPILGISKDIESEINEAVEEFRAEMDSALKMKRKM